MKYLLIATGIILSLFGAYNLTQNDSVGATAFPASLDALTNPTATDRTNVVSHADQHANANDGIEALQAKVGVSSSSVTTSHSYKLSEVLGAYKSVSTGGNQVIEGTKRFVGSLIASSTVLSAISPKFTTDIRDSAGNILFGITASSSAVNYFQISNAGTNGTPRITPAGAGSNIAMWLTGKGSGQVELGDARLKFPDTDGSNGNVLQTNGSGALSWVSPTGLQVASTSVASGTTSLAVLTTAGEKVMIWANGNFDLSADEQSITLRVNGTIVDTAALEISSGSGSTNDMFSLQGLINATTGTTTIGVFVTSPGVKATYTDVSIMALII